jgi:hypothetical protein
VFYLIAAISHRLIADQIDVLYTRLAFINNVVTTRRWSGGPRKRSVARPRAVADRLVKLMGSGSGEVVYLVCRYSPPGNMHGERPAD